MDAGRMVAGLDLVAGLGVVVLAGLIVVRTRRAPWVWGALCLILAALVYVVHAFIEVLELGEHHYALTGLVATILTGGAMVAISRAIPSGWRRP